MGNLLTNSILHIDAASGSAVTGIKKVRLIQWVDDVMDVIDGQDLVFVMGGTTFTTKFGSFTNIILTVWTFHYRCPPDLKKG